MIQPQGSAQRVAVTVAGVIGSDERAGIGGEPPTVVGVEHQQVFVKVVDPGRDHDLAAAVDLERLHQQFPVFVPSNLPGGAALQLQDEVVVDRARLQLSVGVN